MLAIDESPSLHETRPPNPNYILTPQKSVGAGVRNLFNELDRDF